MAILVFFDNLLESVRPAPSDAPTMQLKDLQAFQKIADQGSLHGAASVLGVTQPALSKSLRRLETELGVRLFERAARGVALTSIGRTLYARNQALGQMVDDLRTEIHDLKTGQSGELRLGVVPSMIDTVVAPALASFAGHDAAARFCVHVQLSGQLLRELRGGLLDFALAAVQDDVPPELAYTVLGQQQSCIVTRKGHPLQRRRFALEDLAARQWVLLPGDIALRAWVDQLFSGHGLPAPRLFIETDTTPAAFASLVGRTDLLTVMTMDSLHSPLGAGLAPLPAPAMRWSLQMGLFWRRSAYFSSLMKQCRQRLVQAYAQRTDAMRA
jgi:DNA-binding transcriptional LysR family regulator